jgi:hypothetical protein
LGDRDKRSDVANGIERTCLSTVKPRTLPGRCVVVVVVVLVVTVAITPATATVTATSTTFRG